MNRDVGYALLAALTLTALAALWAFVNAHDLANPDTSQRARGPSGSVPVQPRAPDNSEAVAQAIARLEARDLFEAAAPADMAALNRLASAQIAPPVELIPVEPERQRQRFAALPVQPQIARPPALPLSPPPPRPQAQAPAPVPPPPRPITPSPSAQQIATMRDPRFPLTLRGVFPDPRTGGRAHVALRNGQVVVAGPGGVIEGFQVIRINAASIIVQARGGPPYRLEMPGY